MPAPGTLGGPGLPGRTRIVTAQLTSNVVMERDNFNRFIKDIERSGDRFMEDMAARFERRARQRAPMRTGRLKRSIKSVLYDNKRRLVVLSDVPYGKVQEEGSRPHAIHGVRANFRWRGGFFVWNDPRFGPVGGHQTETHKRHYENWTWEHGATVWHPGTKPKHFFRDAYRETMAEARTVMAKDYH